MAPISSLIWCFRYFGVSGGLVIEREDELYKPYKGYWSIYVIVMRPGCGV